MYKNYNDYKGRGIPVFPENSRVCFLGDSLTAGSLWVQMIFDHYLKAFPKGNIRIDDCGVGQGTAKFGLSTLEDDLYTFDPTHVVIMYGANDVNCIKGNSMERLNSFYNDMKKLTDTLIEKNITVYFMSEPMCEADNYSAIKGRAIANSVMQTLADEYNTHYCDLYTYFSPFITDEMVQPDKIHFTDLGQSVIGRVFLHSQGFDGFSPDDEGFFSKFEMSYDLDHRAVFNHKIRCIWLAMISISTIGDTTEAKIDRLYNRIRTKADGAWDDFCYYRAVDFIEMYPHMSFYREIMEKITDDMIHKALNEASH